MRDISRTAAETPAVTRVLIVDDEKLVRWSISETLLKRGLEIVETATAQAARQAVCDDQPFDVALVDYCLPDAADLSLLASIRRTSPRTRVIFMTAFGAPEVMRSALDLGAYIAIDKPFEMEAIADLVAQAAAH
jgi:DNA-binding NtrC family response regulator